MTKKTTIDWLDKIKQEGKWNKKEPKEIPNMPTPFFEPRPDFDDELLAEEEEQRQEQLKSIPF